MKFPRLRQWVDAIPQSVLIRGINGFLTVIFVLLAVLATNNWLAMIDAFMAGVSSMTIVADIKMQRTFRLMDDMVITLREQQAMNQALIQGKFRMMVAEIEMPDDDAPPTVPKNLH